MDVRVRVAVRRLVAVTVSFVVNVDRYEEKTPVAHAALGDHVLAEALHIAGAPFQDRHLHAAVVIEMQMKRRL
jgi:hypothetical protein